MNLNQHKLMAFDQLVAGYCDCEAVFLDKEWGCDRPVRESEKKTKNKWQNNQKIRPSKTAMQLYMLLSASLEKYTIYLLQYSKHVRGTVI